MTTNGQPRTMKRKRETKNVAPTAEKVKVAAAPIPTKSILKKRKADSSMVAREDAAKRQAEDGKVRRATNGAHNTARALPRTESSAPVTTAMAVTATTGEHGTIVVPAKGPVSIQIVAGSYDRTLHGIVATVRTGSGGDGQSPAGLSIQFTDTFLFNAHASAIRCLALSPPSVPVPGQGQKIMLATGSTDERINIYNLSAHPPAAASMPASKEEQALMASVARRPVMPIAENAKNRELGTLLHHSSSITRLAFPTRSKLLSASEDSTIAVTRTRDWSLLSAIKAPVPKEGMGGGVRRPSGDTAPPGGAPSGVNDFAVHPSMKVMITVSRGERSMRLWNLVTGKKAGVLNFGKDLLRDIGEGKYTSGEGRQVVWGRTGGDDDDAADEYAIGFDRNVVVFGMDSLPRCKVLADARTKTHDFNYVEATLDAGNGDQKLVFSLLAVATEDGRILLCSTRPEDLVPAPAGQPLKDDKKAATTSALPSARLLGQVGGRAAGVTGRIKAFKVLPVIEGAKETQQQQRAWYIVAASSSGAIRLWKLAGDELRDAWTGSGATSAGSSSAAGGSDVAPRQLGTLLGTYETQDRITCVEAFVMLPRPDGLEESDVEDEGDDEEGEEDDGDEDDEDGE